MSKNEYFNAPEGAPPTYNTNQNHQNSYVPQQQPSYNAQTQDRGFLGHQQGYGQPPPPQNYGGYQQGGYQQYPQYYQQQQQPMYVQQQRTSNNESCLMACLAAICICCTLDMLF
ncbi:unnamed protein product [Candida verbasci]|uniref:Cysteine-rich transmembrane domain-containing protein n=1 Tax=Candida verbasci TaxID=1227364 RepID=A0A9W4U0X1_9ASCO|nr:unnamed protein product [Candida verbasci]